MENIIISSINIRGLGRKDKRANIINWIHTNGFNVACFQETYITKENELIISKDFDEKGTLYNCLSDSSHSKGVSIYISKDFPEFTLLNKHTTDNGRAILININLTKSNECYTIVSIYAPNTITDRVNLFKRLKTWIKQYTLDENNIIITGDFNCKLDLINNKDKSVKSLNLLLSYNEIKDTYQYLNPNKYEPTYIHPYDSKRNSKIDYIFGSINLLKHIKFCKILCCPAPDHKAVCISFNKSNNEHGKGYWKLNNSILQEIDYQQFIKHEIKSTINQYSKDTTKQELFEFIKLRVKETSISYCICRNKCKKNKITYLEKCINDIDKNQDKNQCNDNRSNLKTELDELYNENSFGIYIRSRAKWIEKGERSTSFFLRLEKRHQSYNSIDKINDASGNVKTKQSEILEQCEKFYSTLYKSTNPDPENIQKYLSESTIPKLSETEKQKCEGYITKEECEKAVKYMKENKSPGLDGLSIEFYKTFWNELSGILIDSYNEAFETGELSDSRNLSVLSLIFKKGNRSELKNYRPISLSNVDYKILAFVLANRLQDVIGQIVSTDQTGYIKKRFIGTNIRKILDTIEYLETNNKSGILLQLDFEKAFDSVEWSFLINTLSHFNFGSNFINWIKILYKNPKAIIKNNGHLSNTITLKRGIRQGCPVSSLLFILVMEILGSKIKNDNNIAGITASLPTGTFNLKLSQFADDTALLLLNEEQIIKTFILIEQFGKLAGLKLNIKKTEGLWLGAAKHRQANCDIANIKWPVTPIRSLGVFIGINQYECDVKNWYDKILSIEQLIDTWKNRNLTIMGKITIIKTLALPKIIYSAFFTPVPNDVISKINRVLFQFIWGNRDRIKRNTLIADIENGGLNMVDLESKLESVKASWIPKILASTDTWSFYGNYLLNKLCSNNGVVKMNFTNIEQFIYLKKFPKFYQEAITSFTKSKPNIKPTNNLDILNNVIWGNRFFTLKPRKNQSPKCIFFKQWIDSGIIYVKDLKIRNSNLDETYLYQNVNNKTNIIQQIFYTKLALKPYIQLIQNNNPENNHHSFETPPLYNMQSQSQTIDISKLNSKSLYYNLVTQKTVKPYQEVVWETYFEVQNINFKSIYKNKIKNIKEKKLSEFNFKVLHRILPCNDNLKKWKIQNYSFCEICQTKHDIPHLLYYCRKAQSVWDIVYKVFNIHLQVEDLFTGVFEPEFMFLLSILSFLIYTRNGY